MLDKRPGYLSSPTVLDRDYGVLPSSFLEYIDGARMFLESDSEKDSQSGREVRQHFCGFISKLIKSFPLERRNNLMSRDSRRNLFSLFTGWSGKWGKGSSDHPTQGLIPEFEYAALLAMCSVLCCGPCFDSAGLGEDGYIYPWLDNLLSSHEEKIYSLAKETVVLLLEFNQDISPLLDWVVDRCYTGDTSMADGCFLALATIFSTREYLCDHYTAIINVTLLMTGCPRAEIQRTAVLLLMVLDKRFFGSISPLLPDQESEYEVDLRRGATTLDFLLLNNYSSNQMFLSRQLADLHPQLTMPMFSEITSRFASSRPHVRQLLLHYLLPWLYNMELVDPNVPPANPLAYFQYFSGEPQRSGLKKEGWGSAEATEMVLNNLFYVTAKFGDLHPRELEEIWSTLCSCWPNNLRVILRYLLIVTGMAPDRLLPFAKRVVVYMGRSRPEHLVDELMNELQTVEALNYIIERTETPPFFRVTSVRKTSSPSHSTHTETQSDGTIHTKRHSGMGGGSIVGSGDELPITPKVGLEAGGSVRSVTSSTTSGTKAERSYTHTVSSGFSEDSAKPSETTVQQEDNFSLLRRQTEGGAMGEKWDAQPPLPHPLPMPEYGGYFAPLTEFLPDSSQSINTFYRCNLAVMLLTDVITDGIDLDSHTIDWSVHVPLMLHIIFLGLDHSRQLVHEHCKMFLLNLITVLTKHNDHLSIATVLLNIQAESLGYGLSLSTLPARPQNFTEADSLIDQYLDTPPSLHPALQLQQPSSLSSSGVASTAETSSTSLSSVPAIVTSDEERSPGSPPSVALQELCIPENTSSLSTEDVIKSLIQFIASKRSQPLWMYEDITARVWTIKSVEQLDRFLRSVLRVLQESLPHALIEERWAQIALQLSLSSSSRHSAGRSLQVFRSLRVPINSRMFTDILSRLVETVAEQGDDMQGYVTELMLTLEAAVDNLDSDFRPMDCMKEIFKSTPNLNHGGCGGILRRGIPGPSLHSPTSHMRSTSYSVSYGTRKPLPGSPTSDLCKVYADMRYRSNTEGESKLKLLSNLSRSRSAQSLRPLQDQNSQDDKLALLAQLFWIGVSLLESDYEYEFLLACRLLEKVLNKLPLERPDCREKVEKLQAQLGFSSFAGVHALVLKGVTSPQTYDASLQLVSRFTKLLEVSVIDPSQANGFAFNVMALLPYMVYHYEDANELCITSAENIAQVSQEKGKKLENLGTVMTLYSRRTFSKESLQWTKCVVKYLHDTYSHLAVNLMAFLVEVLEKGPTFLQSAVLSILHCLLQQLDVTAPTSSPLNADLLRVIGKYIEGHHWKDALKILKLVVTRSSSLAAPATGWEGSHYTHSDVLIELGGKKELPGRTMEFTFDVSQTPVIARRFMKPLTGQIAAAEEPTQAGVSSPRRSLTHNVSQDNTPVSSWKKPWNSQARVRECLVNLLNTCGQRVGLPKSPSVIFSQSSEVGELVGVGGGGGGSSMASSMEEVSGGPGGGAGQGGEQSARSGGSTPDAHFVIRDFDFLEYELGSMESESIDNFNWGVRARSLSNMTSVGGSTGVPEQGSERECDPPREESSDDDGRSGSISPLEDLESSDMGESRSVGGVSSTGLSHSLPLLERSRHSSVASQSSSSSLSSVSVGEVTPCNVSPRLPPLMQAFRPLGGAESSAEVAWRGHVGSLIIQPTSLLASQTFVIFSNLFKEVSRRFSVLTREVCGYLSAWESLHSLSTQLDRGLSESCPYVWCDPLVFSCTESLHKHRFCVLEIHEHWETYLEKKDHALEMAESAPRGNQDNTVDVCRALYKLHFQLALLFNSYCKLIQGLPNPSVQSQVVDLSVEISIMQLELQRAVTQQGDLVDMEEMDLPQVQEPDPGIKLISLLEAQQWTEALQLFQTNRDGIPSISGHDEDDVTAILTVYCEQHTATKQGVLAVTRTEQELVEASSRLMDTSMQLLASLRAMEQGEGSSQPPTEC